MKVEVPVEILNAKQLIHAYYCITGRIFYLNDIMDKFPILEGGNRICYVDRMHGIVPQYSLNDLKTAYDLQGEISALDNPIPELQS